MFPSSSVVSVSTAEHVMMSLPYVPYVVKRVMLYSFGRASISPAEFMMYDVVTPALP